MQQTKQSQIPKLFPINSKIYFTFILMWFNYTIQIPLSSSIFYLFIFIF